MGASGHPDACHHENDYDWRFEPEYPISNLNPEVDKIEWMKEEINMGEPDRFDDLISEPIRDPIIVIEVNDTGEIVDGWHRTVACCLTGRKTIPAFVGVLKENHF